MPDINDIEKIEKMIHKLGENELEIGELKPEETAREEPETQPKEEGLPSEISEGAGEEGEEAAEGLASGDEEDLLELLKDIEIGLSEEKELEEKLLSRKEGGEGEAEVQDTFPEVPGERPPGEVLPSEQEVEEFEEEAASMAGPSVEGPPPEKPSPEEFSLDDTGIEGGEIPQKETEGEATEEGFDLPGDFDIDDLELAEGPPEALFKKEELQAGETEGEEEAAKTEGEIPQTFEAAEEEKELPAESEEETRQPSTGPELFAEMGISEAEAPEEAEKPEFDFEMPDLEDIEKLEETEEPLKPETAESKAEIDILKEMGEEIQEGPAFQEEIGKPSEKGPSGEGFELPGFEEISAANEEAVVSDEGKFIEDEILGEEDLRKLTDETLAEEEELKTPGPPAEGEPGGAEEGVPGVGMEEGLEALGLPGEGEPEGPEEGVSAEGVEEGLEGLGLPGEGEPEGPEEGVPAEGVEEGLEGLGPPGEGGLEAGEDLELAELLAGEGLEEFGETPEEKGEEEAAEVVGDLPSLEEELSALEEEALAEGVEVPSEEVPSEGIPSEEVPPIEERPAPTGEIDIDLSEEDILLIKTKLKQLPPYLASVIRDIIVEVSIPTQSMKDLLDLLIQDKPEIEILRFVEEATGRSIVPTIRKPEVAPIPVRPRRALAENLGALTRVGGLFIAIVALLGIIFMVFLYKPIKSTRYYREGIEYLKEENYSEAEKSFSRAVAIYEKIKEYDNYGWMYMLSGNYEAALKKFQTGVEIDPEVNNIEIRLHLAKLYNILGGKDYEKADALYDKVIEKKPKIYLYKKLKGQNLIDWGVQEETRLDEAYQIFNSEFSENRRNTDPLFQMLKITIMKEDNENISFLYSLLQKKFPLAVDSEVYTKLASYFVTESLRDPKNSPLDPVRDILASVIERYPGYPKAYFTLSLYHKILNNKEEEERLLKATILYERERPLEYPWEYRDRDLISDAFNNLGELYQRIEIPGKTAEAINYFNKAIEENPENKKAYFNLAQAYFYDEKNYSRAQRYYEIAKKLGYADRDLDYNLGLVYFYGKKFERALNQWAKLTELEPDNPNINFAMGSVFLHMNKYNAALGELLLLAELYGELVKDLGEIKPWSAYHKRIVLSGASVYNNLGVAYQKLYEATGKSGYQRDSLLYLYKAGELADIIGTERGPIQYNINYIIHPNVSRSEMAINDNISENYRFVTQ